MNKQNEFLSERELLARMLTAVENINNKIPTLHQASLAEASDVMDNKELCSVLKMHPRTAAKWRKQKKLPFYKTGKKIYYSIKEVEAALNIKIKR